VDIVDLISKRLTLKKVGGSYRAPCPFHGGKNPNFAVNGHEQFYHCFKKNRIFITLNLFQLGF
jgi:DNA primase